MYHFLILNISTLKDEASTWRSRWQVPSHRSSLTSNNFTRLKLLQLWTFVIYAGMCLQFGCKKFAKSLLYWFIYTIYSFLLLMQGAAERWVAETWWQDCSGYGHEGLTGEEKCSIHPCSIPVTLDKPTVITTSQNMAACNCRMRCLMKPRKKQRNKRSIRMVKQNANRVMNMMMDRMTLMMEKKQNLRKWKNSTMRWSHRTC